VALSRQRKEELVAEVASLLEGSKLTVLAKYSGVSVKSMQSLKRASKENQTTVKVVKNRLVVKAIESLDKFKDTDTDALTGQLLYAFNSEDEVAPAQLLANFAKSEPSVEFVGAFSEDGAFLGAEDVKALASLPSKDQLRGQLVGLFASPLSGFVGVMSGNLRSIFNVLNSRAQALK
jgi:large subunit ribosomal protein L10